jgi:hypothetical protein
LTVQFVLVCWNCGKEYSDVPLNQRPYLCECGGYVVSPSGKTQGKWIMDESTAYGNDCRGGRCDMKGANTHE